MIAKYFQSQTIIIHKTITYISVKNLVDYLPLIKLPLFQSRNAKI